MTGWQKKYLKGASFREYQVKPTYRMERIAKGRIINEPAQRVIGVKRHWGGL